VSHSTSERNKQVAMEDCVPYVYEQDGWWHATVTFKGEVRYIGRVGSETQAKRVAERWRAALVGETDKLAGPKQRRDGAGRPVAAAPHMNRAAFLRAEANKKANP
jgi:hypothetical protein